jgi:hypothetical protein
MQCSAPPPLTDDQLSAVLDGEPAPDVRAHLAACAACAARLEQARRVEKGMRAALHRWDCPPSQRLAEYHIGRLAGEQERALQRHLEACASCKQEIEDLRLFLLEDVDQAAPAPTPAAAQPAPARRGPLIARLLPRVAAPALRGAGGGPIQAQADGITIFLDVRAAGAGQVAIQGQVVADEQERWAGALVELRQGGALLATAAIDDLGMFGVGPIPAGLAELRLIPRRGRAVALPDLDLSASGG